MTARAGGARSYRPEAGRFWIRHVPVGWPGAEGLWVDLARRTLGEAGDGDVPDLTPESVTDLVYLPPVGRTQTAHVDALAETLRAASVPVIRQWVPSLAEARPRGGEEQIVVDLLGLLIRDGLGVLETLDCDCTTAVWPLISGLTSEAELWEPGLDALAALGFEVVVPQALELDPSQRRRLAAYADESAYQALFHGGLPETREFARAAARRGLSTLIERPALGVAPRFAFRRRAATELIVVADLWLRLGRSEAAGQELLRAARWAEESEHDLRAIALEGNLGVVPWLDELSRQVVRDLAVDSTQRGGSSLRRALERELLESA